LEIEGELSSSLTDIQNNIQSFYTSLFGVESCKKASLDVNFWDSKFCVSPTQILSLEAPFTEFELKELKDAIFGSNASGLLAQMTLVLLFTSIFMS
jgi:hypothetical protein